MSDKTEIGTSKRNWLELDTPIERRLGELLHYNQAILHNLSVFMHTLTDAKMPERDFDNLCSRFHVVINEMSGICDDAETCVRHNALAEGG